MPLWRGGPNTRILPTVLLTPPPSKAADMAHLCVPQNQALVVCRGFVPDIQVCGTHGREDLVKATITLNAEEEEVLLLFVGCLTSQQHASVSQGQICSDNFTCCHTEIEVADQTFHLTQSQYTDTGPTSPSTDPLECQFRSHWYDSTPKKSWHKRDSNPGSSNLEADAVTTWPTRQSQKKKKT